MASLRGRVKKLERDTVGDKSTLVCPTCGEEFTVYGDAPLEYLCWAWEQDYEGETYRKTPEDVLRLVSHEHDASAFVDKATGEPFMGEFFRGMGPTMHERPENVEDLSEK
jgi:hypothetical protein